MGSAAPQFETGITDTMILNPVPLVLPAQAGISVLDSRWRVGIRIIGGTRRWDEKGGSNLFGWRPSVCRSGSISRRALPGHWAKVPRRIPDERLGTTLRGPPAPGRTRCPRPGWLLGPPYLWRSFLSRWWSGRGKSSARWACRPRRSPEDSPTPPSNPSRAVRALGAWGDMGAAYPQPAAGDACVLRHRRRN